MMPPVSIDVDLQLCYASDKARGVDPRSVDTLADSIEQSGLLQPITVRRVQKSRAGQMADAFEIIAGVHRVKAFRKLGRPTIPAFVVDMDDLHAELALIDENLCRNDLTTAERAAAQSRRKAIYQELHPETKNGAAGKHRPKSQLGQIGQAEDGEAAPRFDEAAADATGQSQRTIRRDVTRGEALGDAALARVARTSLDKGEELDALAKMSEPQRESLISRAVSGEKVSAKVELKKTLRADKEQALGAKQRALPQKRYGVIYADPEWRFETYSDNGMDRSADNHYPTSDLLDIINRPVGQIAADDCVLFLWATAPMLPQAIRVMQGWGFEYKSHVIWRKDRAGTGYWFRNWHELLLVGTRGHIPAPAMGTQFPSVIDAQVGEHSAKPDAFYEAIERYFPSLPKIELNARRARAGWDAWGNEAPLESVDLDTGEIAPEVVPVASASPSTTQPTGPGDA